MPNIFGNDDDLFNAGNDPWASSSKLSQNMNQGGSSSILQDNNWNSYNSNDILSGKTYGANEDVFRADDGYDESKEPLGVDQEPGEDTEEQIIDATPLAKTITHNEDNDPEEEDTYQVGGNSVWAEDAIARFSPLSYHNSDDKTIVNVKEIPEKEGLVFKHINYLVSHNLRFSQEYYREANENSKVKQQAPRNGETKVIRRYSDFDWLVEVLWKKYPYRLIPELPPKKFACK